MQKDKVHIRKLIDRIRDSGDQKAFEELFRIFYEPLINFCVAYIHNKEQAEEIVSNVFLKLWLKKEELDRIHNPETYLFIAVKNHSLNYLKQYSNYKVVYLEETGLPEIVNAYDTEKELEQRELICRLEQAIESLPTQCRIIFMLVKEEGLKYKEVAGILDISPRTVETQLVRAIKKLSLTLKPYSGTKDPSPEKQNPLNVLRLLF